MYGTNTQFLHFLQFVSPSLPVGAYSYSEGLETLVEQGVITQIEQLEHWLMRELQYGGVRLEGAVMTRSRLCILEQDWSKLNFWNDWLFATRDSAELRQQSEQMGQSLIKLLVHLQPDAATILDHLHHSCHYAIAFSISATLWQIPPEFFILGYLQSWATNLINAGVKLIPLGQTQGQKLLFNLSPLLETVTEQILSLADDQLETCSWGTSLASMQHETQYTRLFRS